MSHLFESEKVNDLVSILKDARCTQRDIEARNFAAADIGQVESGHGDVLLYRVALNDLSFPLVDDQSLVGILEPGYVLNPRQPIAGMVLKPTYNTTKIKSLID